ncbi:adenine phosphoribosyltransferase [Clarireedia jacksonii]
MTSQQSLEPNQPTSTENAARRHSPTTSSSTSELTSVTLKLRQSLRQFPDFPIPGIDFVDILPLFASHSLHESLIRALELQVLLFDNGKKPDVIVGLDARGFLFGPSLALTLGAGFAPVRKRGKLPGPTEEASFDKEYGQDFFQIQQDAIKPGQTVLVVDDIIATGKLIKFHSDHQACQHRPRCDEGNTWLTFSDRWVCSGCRKAC